MLFPHLSADAALQTLAPALTRLLTHLLRPPPRLSFLFLVFIFHLVQKI